MRKLLLTLIALFAFSFPVFASNWISIGTDTDGTEYSVDISRMSTHNLTQLEENQNRIVERMGYEGVNVPYKSLWLRAQNTDGTSIIKHINVYQNGKIAPLGYVYYDSHGDVIESVPDGYPRPYEPYPDSVGEELYKFAYPLNS